MEQKSDSPPLAPGDKIELHIDRLAAGGSGVGRHRGFVVFVPYTAPDEKVLVEIQSVQKRFAEANLLEILAPSPHRVSPTCSVFGECGGCTWQHVNYEEQFHQKQLIVEKAIAPLKDGSTKISPPISSSRQWHYRNRIEIQKDHGNVGFRKRKSHEIVDIKACPIADEQISKKLDSIKNSQSFPSGRYDIRTLENGQATITHLDEKQNSPGFTQVNKEQNRVLIQKVVELAQRIQPEKILDLYCGNGNFTFPLAEAFPTASILGIDSGKQSISEAKSRSQTLERAAPVTFHREFIQTKTILDRDLEDTLVILDPPRTGTEKGLLAEIALRKPKGIVYISCNPATFARDVRTSKEKCSKKNLILKLAEVFMLDMFPQTDHIELASFLTVSTPS